MMISAKTDTKNTEEKWEGRNSGLARLRGLSGESNHQTIWRQSPGTSWDNQRQYRYIAPPIKGGTSSRAPCGLSCTTAGEEAS
ncbi:hypothetical protein CL614_05080 [archaeon]|nr:hypothetical protein [archaeon]